MRKFALSLVATFALALAITGSSASPAAAYGNDAIYQIEFSLNCTDRNSTFCTQVVGLGGLWGWIAVGNDGFADVEATFCGHGFPLRRRPRRVRLPGHRGSLLLHAGAGHQRNSADREDPEPLSRFSGMNETGPATDRSGPCFFV